MFGEEFHTGIFLDVVETILADLNPDNALETLVTGLRRLRGVGACSVFQPDADPAYFRIRCQSGMGRAFAESIRVPVSKSLSGKAFLGRQVVVVDDVAPIRDYHPSGYRWLLRRGLKSIVSVPLIARDRRVGVLTLYCEELISPSELDDRAIRACAHVAALAIDNARLYHEKVRAAQELELLNRQHLEQRELLQRARTVHEWLVKTVLDVDGLDSVTEALGRLAQTTVVVEDSHLNVLSVYQPQRGLVEDEREDASLGLGAFASDLRVQEHLSRVRTARRPELLSGIAEIGLKVPRITAPVVVGGSLLGFVSILGGNREVGQIDFPLAEEGALAIALEMMKRKVAFETEQKVRGDFLRSILAGQFKNLDEAGVVIAGTKFNLRALCRVAIIRPDRQDAGPRAESQTGRRDSLLSMIYRAAERLIAEAYPETILIAEEESVVLLLGSDLKLSDTLVRQLLGRIIGEVAARAVPLTASAGIGGSCAHPRDLRRSFVEAGEALEAAAMLGKQSAVLLFSELGILSILLHRSSPEELTEFACKYLAPLIAYDRSHEGELMQTLSAYIRCDFHPYETARELAVHPKTVAYRLGRIEQLCGVDVGRSDDLMNLQIALRLHGLFT